MCTHVQCMFLTSRHCCPTKSSKEHVKYLFRCNVSYKKKNNYRFALLVIHGISQKMHGRKEGGGVSQGKKNNTNNKWVGWVGSHVHVMCGSRKYPYMYPHHRGSLEIPRGRGVLKAKIFKAKHEPKLEFPEEWGFKAKNPSREEYGYFLEQHIASVCFPGILGCKRPFELWEIRLMEYFMYEIEFNSIHSNLP